jgi:EmrB/QacA subfamily drug resistance transporter
MPSTSSKRLILATMCLGTFMAILDTSLVNLGLHRIQEDLRADMTLLQWVVDLYNLAYAVLILTGGTLSDLYGRRRVFLLGVLVFAVGSLICAAAPNAMTLVAGRGIAGIGAALELPAALAILNVTYPDARQRAHAIAIWGGMNGLAMAIGPTIGGVLVDAFGWRSLFLAIMPIAAVTGLLGFACLAESADPEGRALDWPGQALTVVTLGATSLAFIQGPNWGWLAPSVLACFATGAIALVLFILVERRTRFPMLPLSVFGSPAFCTAVADAALMTFGMYGLLFLLPMYLQIAQHDTALLAGVALLPMSLTFFVVSLAAGPVATAIGPRVLIGGGMTLTAIGMLLLSGLSEQSAYGRVATALFAVGVGLGLITGPIATAAVANAPATHSGLSSGLVNTGRMVGATLGVAALGILLGGRAEAAARNVPRFIHGMQWAFVMGAVAEFAGALLAVVWFRRDSLESRPRDTPSRLARQLS